MGTGRGGLPVSEAHASGSPSFIFAATLALALPLSPGFSGDLPPSEDLARGGQRPQWGIEDKGQGQAVSRLTILRVCQFSASIRKSTYINWTH